jgi:hypothetical protein
MMHSCCFYAILLDALVFFYSKFTQHHHLLTKDKNRERRKPEVSVTYVNKDEMEQSGCSFLPSDRLVTCTGFGLMSFEMVIRNIIRLIHNDALLLFLCNFVGRIGVLRMFNLS